MTPEQVAALLALAERASPEKWRIHHYIPHGPMAGPLNSWFTSIVEPIPAHETLGPVPSRIPEAREIARCLDWRTKRTIDDPGEAPNAEYLCAAANLAPDLARSWLEMRAALERIVQLDPEAEAESPYNNCFIIAEAALKK
jgi:hypothetical protein